MQYDVVHNASVNFKNDFVCNFLNKSEPSYQLEMVYSYYKVAASVRDQPQRSFKDSWTWIQPGSGHFLCLV